MHFLKREVLARGSAAGTVARGKARSHASSSNDLVAAPAGDTFRSFVNVGVTMVFGARYRN